MNFITGNFKKIFLIFIGLLPLLVFPYTHDSFVFPKIAFSSIFFSIYSTILIFKAIYKKNIFIYKNSLIFIFAFLILLIGFLNSYNRLLSIYKNYILICYFTTLLLVFNINKFKEKDLHFLKKILVFSTLIISIYTILQFFNIDFFNSNFENIEKTKKLFSTLGNKNFTAYFLVTFLPLFTDIKKKYLIIFPVLAIFLSLCRGAIIVLFIQIFLGLLLKINKNILKKVSILTILFIFLTIIIFNNKRQFKILKNWDFRYPTSVIQRILIFKSSLLCIKNNPYGIGLGNFQNFYFKEQAKIILKNEMFSQYICNAQHAHNEYLEIMAELGIISGLILIIIMFYYTKLLYSLDKTIFLVYIALLLNALFSFTFHLPAIAIPGFFISIFPYFIYKNYIKIKLTSILKISFLSILPVFLIIGIFSYKYLMSEIMLNKYIITANTKFLKKSIEYLPFNPDANFKSGVLFLNLKKYENAISFFEKSLRFQEFPSRFYYVGLCYYLNKDYILAKLYFNKTIQLSPYHYHAHYYLGNIYERFNNKKKANEKYKLLETIIRKKLWQF